MTKKILFLSSLIVFFLSNTAKASHVVHCLLLGENTQVIDQSDDLFEFQLSVSSSMNIGSGYTDCQEYLNSDKIVALVKSDIPKEISINIGDQIFIEYYHISDKGGVHKNSYHYIGHHDKNH